MSSPLLACVFRIEKITSCLRWRAMFSRPMDSAMVTSSCTGLFFSTVRLMALRDAASSSGEMMSPSGPSIPV